MTFKKTLGGGQLMPGINREGQFLLIEVVKTTVSQNILTEVGTIKIPAMVNIY